MHKHTEVPPYGVKNFAPLIIILFFVVALTLTMLYASNSLWSIHAIMRFFMASFFLIFGTFKIINLRGFASGYSMYDLVATRWYNYGYIYPFLELGLGLAYLFNVNPDLTNIITIGIMLLSAAGVLKALLKGEHLMCACLGTVFKIPMTYVTLLEDLLMAGMAFFMLFMQG